MLLLLFVIVVLLHVHLHLKQLVIIEAIGLFSFFNFI